MYDSLVRLMFANIDKADWPALEECFHPDATYERPGYDPLVGRDRLMQFYRYERAVASGQHTVDGSLTNGEDGAAWGRMAGTLKTGMSVTVQFAEVYRFEDGKIRHRRSYFFTPAV